MEHQFPRRRTLGFAAAAAIGWTAALPARAVVIDYVPVGNPGNAADTGSGRPIGAVAADFAIGRTEVTNAQYAEFLNAKAASDPLGLYNPSMGAIGNGGIVRVGASGSYTYAVKPGQGGQPVVYVSLYDAMRFANWLHNGQGAGSTEAGAYTLTGGTATPANAAGIARAPGAQVFLPSEDQWFKAAYYDPAKPGGAGYWLYPTRTDAVPYSDQPPGADAPDAANVVNYFRNDGVANGYDDGYAVTGSPTFNGGVSHLNAAGAYAGSRGPYGTFDQGGNAAEWNDTFVAAITPSVILRGGAFDNAAGGIVRIAGSQSAADAEESRTGFRVAGVVPEPAGAAAVAAAAAGLLARCRRRR